MIFRASDESQAISCASSGYLQILFAVESSILRRLNLVSFR
jgi:hypothetical protein